MSLKDRFAALESRERRLLGVLGGVFAALGLFAVPWVIATTVASARSENEAYQEAIDALQSSADQVSLRQAEREALTRRYARPAPPIAAFLEGLARELQIGSIPESRDLPVVPHGKRYEERATRVVFRKIDMLKLIRLMERIETSGLPLTISQLNIRKRGTEVDSFDVEMTVSAFDQKAPEPAKKEKEKESPEAAAEEDE